MSLSKENRREPALVHWTVEELRLKPGETWEGQGWSTNRLPKVLARAASTQDAQGRSMLRSDDLDQLSTTYAKEVRFYHHFIPQLIKNNLNYIF